MADALHAASSTSAGRRLRRRQRSACRSPSSSTATSRAQPVIAGTRPARRRPGRPLAGERRDGPGRGRRRGATPARARASARPLGEAALDAGVCQPRGPSSQALVQGVSSSTPPGSRLGASCASSGGSSTRRSAGWSRAAGSIVLGTAARGLRPIRRRDRAARARGLRPLGRQGGRAAAPPRSSSTSRPAPRDGIGSTPPLPALATLGLRLRPGRPDRPRRTTMPELDWERPLPARSRSSPAPRAGSAQRSPRRSPATAPTSSASTSRRWPTISSRSIEPIGGSALAADITADDAPAAIADHLAAEHGGVDVVVHNAGVTRDKTLGADGRRSAGTRLIEINLSARSGSTTSCSAATLLRPERPRSSASPRSAGSPATPARPTTRPRRRA